jgi:predicted transcriptional regulator
MTQLCIDFAPAARATDPTTSHQAAAQARQLAADHHRIILAALEAHGPLGKDGIASRTSLTGVAVCRRLTELQRMGRVTLTGRNVQSTAGRAEREWMAEEGCYFFDQGDKDGRALRG